MREWTFIFLSFIYFAFLVLIRIGTIMIHWYKTKELNFLRISLSFLSALFNIFCITGIADNIVLQILNSLPLFFCQVTAAFIWPRHLHNSHNFIREYITAAFWILSRSALFFCDKLECHTTEDWIIYCSLYICGEAETSCLSKACHNKCVLNNLDWHLLKVA